MFKKKYSIFLTMALLCMLRAGVTAAQDAGEYLILSAQYGNERNHVDVTNRLKDLARHDRRFQVSYESMRVDPDRGQAKMLRVFARGPNGQEQSFDFPDGSWFDGAQFRSWERADWGEERWNGGWNGREARGRDEGQYLILTAQYGNEYQHVDVSAQLKQLARQDRVFRLDYRTFGVDPAVGQAKVLRIFARDPNGQEQMFEYQDNSMIDGAQFRGWGTGEWGGGGWSGNWAGGGHGREGEGHDRDLEHHDRDAAGQGEDAGEFLILSAQYGSQRRHVDVTDQLKELARRDRQFRLDYRTFGVDPAEGHAKVLRIYARGPHGRERMFEYRDGSVIDGAQFRGWRRGEWAGPNDHWSGRWEGEQEERDRDRRY
jgi:hypothetical protein